MSWVTIVWSMDAAVCVTLGTMFLLVWLHQPDNFPYLLFATSAFGVACFAMLELAMMRASTPEMYGTLVRWAHVPAWVVVVSLVWFVRLYLGAGRPWLAWTVCGMRTVSLVLDFYLSPNLNFREISAVDHLAWWSGEMVSAPVGIPSPWTLVGQASLLLFAIYAIDATMTVWRRGERRRALLVGASMVFFVLAVTGLAALVIWGVVRAPVIIGLPFFGILGVMAYELSTDVLRAAKLSAALQESQQRIVLAAEAARLAIWSWDIPGDAIWVTDEGRPLYGVSRDEKKITWERFVATLHPDDRGGLQLARESAMRGDGKFSTDYRVVLPDASVRWITALGRIEFGAVGQPLRLRGVSLDVTERKRAELEAVQNRDELTHLSRVTMLGELSGSLAHELNQPLTAILSNAQAAQRFLEREPIDVEELREILEDIVTQDRRAGEVIRRLRLLLKKGEVLRQPLDVNEVVREVLKLMGSDLVNQQISVETELKADLPQVLGDRVQLQQVLVNLIMNAGDAMAENAPADRQLTLITRPTEDGGVRVEVRDQGRGVSVDGLPRVFEPFFTTKLNGLGLGLSVCQTIIAAHGGTLTVANNPDRGATFLFTLSNAGAVT
jgi:two-component system sensor kinase FixL